MDSTKYDNADASVAGSTDSTADLKGERIFFKTSSNNDGMYPQLDSAYNDLISNDLLDTMTKSGADFNHKILNDYEENINIIKIRYLSTSDASRIDRDEWISGVFQYVEKHSLNYFETYSVSSSSGHFDMLIIGADDTSRACRFLKENYSLVKNRPKILLENRSDPKRRARALRSGFDDVFEFARTSKPEAICRLIAIHRRTKLTQETRRQHEKYDEIIAEILIEDAILTDAEYRVIKELIHNNKKILSYERLQVIASRSVELISMANLKVIISRLRKKIKRKFLIKSESGYGYAIKSLT